MRAASPAPLHLTAGSLALLALTLPGQISCKGCASDQTIIPQGDDTAATVAPPAPYENDWGQWLSMDVMSDGRPALAYYDRTKGALGFAIANVDGDTVTWDREKPDGWTDDNGMDVGDRGKYTGMAVAHDGTVWVSYQDVTLQALRAARRDPNTGEWTNMAADGGGEPSGTGGMFSSVALDAASSPVIVHYDDMMRQLRMARWNGTAFSTSVIDAGEAVTDADGAEVPADVGGYADIAIADGVEYMAYYDAAAGNLKLAWGTPGNYTIEVVDDGGGNKHLDGGGDVGQWPDVLITDGQVWISYQDVGNQDLLLAHGVPGSWTTEVVDNGEYVGADTALFLNGTEMSMAYFDGRNNDMKMATKIGDAWQVSTLASDGALGFHNAVVLSNGSYFVACYDYTRRTVWFDHLR